MSYSALICKNRELSQSQSRVHDCVICGQSTSIVRPVCDGCKRD
jgi:hypothetical protein